MSKSTSTPSATTQQSAKPEKAPKVKKSKGRTPAGAIDAKVEQTSSGGNRMTVFGMSACKILKWMGSNGWTRKEATIVCTHIWPNLSASTIGCQFYSGRALAAGNQPTHSGKSAELSKDQIGELEALKKQLVK